MLMSTFEAVLWFAGPSASSPLRFEATGALVARSSLGSAKASRRVPVYACWCPVGGCSKANKRLRKDRDFRAVQDALSTHLEAHFERMPKLLWMCLPGGCRGFLAHVGYRFDIQFRT